MHLPLKSHKLPNVRFAYLSGVYASGFPTVVWPYKVINYHARYTHPNAEVSLKFQAQELLYEIRDDGYGVKRVVVDEVSRSEIWSVE